ncbi:translation initiation factor IF-2 subunit gamma [Candidatus Bathyarchaeota archaeon]|jgi:translation initiation factor 2 subunit 3|nr:translation initiation factor IF-2 subunit gamma [Candidatus Bathyarchaeota archaeon]
MSAEDTDLKGEDEEVSIRQPEVNIGTLGHVDNGKSTLVQSVTGVWTGRHSEELKRGITIRIGYADVFIYRCPKCKPPHNYSTGPKCPHCGSETKFKRGVSFVDCPGHHSLMVTMLAGAALMDGALFVVASNVKFPQAQDREHLLAAQMVGIQRVIVVQNKIDLVDRTRALENYAEIKSFTKDTIAADAPVIPVSAQHGANTDVVLYEMEKRIPTPKRDSTASPRMYVLRSFDINKPGTEIEELHGGILGGSIIQGSFRVGDEVEIRPGLAVESGAKTHYEPLISKVTSLSISKGPVTEARSGGLVGVGTSLDPSLTKSDGLVGSVVGKAGELPPVLEKLTAEVMLFERAVGTEQLVPVDKIRTNEPLVLNVGTAVTSGVVTSAREDIVDVSLRKPVCPIPGFKIAVSRRIGDSWRLIGFGTLKG